MQQKLLNFHSPTQRDSAADLPAPIERAIDLFHRIRLERRRNLVPSGKTEHDVDFRVRTDRTAADVFLAFNQRERRHADFTGATPPSANRYDCNASPTFMAAKRERETLLASLSSRL
jgi:hypothetical protein